METLPVRKEVLARLVWVYQRLRQLAIVGQHPRICLRQFSAQRGSQSGGFAFSARIGESSDIVRQAPYGKMRSSREAR